MGGSLAYGCLHLCSWQAAGLLTKEGKKVASRGRSASAQQLHEHVQKIRGTKVDQDEDGDDSDVTPTEQEESSEDQAEQDQNLGQGDEEQGGEEEGDEEQEGEEQGDEEKEDDEMGEKEQGGEELIESAESGERDLLYEGEEEDHQENDPVIPIPPPEESLQQACQTEGNPDNFPTLSLHGLDCDSQLDLQDSQVVPDAFSVLSPEPTPTATGKTAVFHGKTLPSTQPPENKDAPKVVESLLDSDEEDIETKGTFQAGTSYHLSKHSAAASLT